MGRLPGAHGNGAWLESHHTAVQGESVQGCHQVSALQSVPGDSPRAMPEVGDLLLLSPLPRYLSIS